MGRTNGEVGAEVGLGLGRRGLLMHGRLDVEGLLLLPELGRPREHPSPAHAAEGERPQARALSPRR